MGGVCSDDLWTRGLVAFPVQPRFKRENPIAILRLIQGEFPVVTARRGIDQPRRVVPWQRNATLPATILPFWRGGGGRFFPDGLKRSSVANDLSIYDLTYLMTRQDRLNDELLVLRCQQGDAEAFTSLVGRWQQRLWRHAWRLTGNESAAWDVIQETWIGISRGINRLVDAAAFPAWAYQIVSNKCRDSVRCDRRRREAAETYAQWMQREEHEAAIAEEQYNDLREAIEHLSGPDRAVLALRYEENFDTAEIASILGIPEGTVKSRLFYARGRLRNYSRPAVVAGSSAFITVRLSVHHWPVNMAHFAGAPVTIEAPHLGVPIYYTICIHMDHGECKGL